jgi:hypothetical protein
MVSAVRQATLRLSLRPGFLKKREKWRTPSYFGLRSKTTPRYTSHVMWPTCLLRPNQRYDNLAGVSRCQSDAVRNFIRGRFGKKNGTRYFNNHKLLDHRLAL